MAQGILSGHKVKRNQPITLLICLGTDLLLVYMVPIHGTKIQHEILHDNVVNGGLGTNCIFVR